MNTDTRRFDHTGLQIVDDAECLQLLSSVPLGRLVFTKGGLPAVRLVNFFVDHDTVIFWTSDGDEYRAAERGDVVAFEVDDIDLDRHLDWTVTAAGHLSVVDPDEPLVAPQPSREHRRDQDVGTTTSVPTGTSRGW